MVDLQRQYLGIRNEIDEAIASVLCTTDFIQGSAVASFEHELADYLSVTHVVGCGSGTDALQIAMMALGIGVGDEVITTPFTFVATTETIVLLGAVPVYVDIDPQTYTLNVGEIESKITPKTKAIIPVHLYGQPAEMDALLQIARRHHLRVIEDVAQAIGARFDDRFVAGLGDIGCLSFFPSKNLGAYGDAGALVTNDSDLASRCRLIAAHGSKVKYRHEVLGVNSRLDTLQAAILRVKLRHLEEWTEARIRVAHKYNELLRDLDVQTPYCSPRVRHVYHQYSVRTSHRDALAAYLKLQGIAHAVHYPTPLHRQPAFKHLLTEGVGYPITERIAGQILSLPIFPEISAEEVIEVAEAVRTFFGRRESAEQLP